MMKVLTLAATLALVQASTLSQLSSLLFPAGTTDREGSGGILDSIDRFYGQLFEVYGMLTRSEDYLEKQRERHESSGAFRSGEGTPQQIA
jgi:hypothetical protein